MAKGYWVSVYPAISDPERLTAYDKLARPAVQAGGGRVLSRGGRVVAHEAGITQRVVLIEFDSFEQAVAAYESEAYHCPRPCGVRSMKFHTGASRSMPRSLMSGPILGCAV